MHLFDPQICRASIHTMLHIKSRSHMWLNRHSSPLPFLSLPFLSLEKTACNFAQKYVSRWEPWVVPDWCLSSALAFPSDLGARRPCTKPFGPFYCRVDFVAETEALGFLRPGSWSWGWQKEKVTEEKGNWRNCKSESTQELCAHFPFKPIRWFIRMS